MKTKAIIMAIIIALCLFCDALALENSVIVQQKQCYRSWESSDTITMVMSASSWERWKRDHEYRLINQTVRFVVGEYGERYSTVKSYDWITYKDCK